MPVAPARCLALVALLLALSWPTAAHAADPVIAAAGDIACSPSGTYYNGGNGTADACRMKYTSNLLVNAGLSAVLPIGDTQYDTAKLTSYMSSYDPTWGRVKSISRPAIGNHEYKSTDAAGYFDYFNGTGNFTGPAGDRDKGYYSFDVGTWHLIALNSNDMCTIVACGAGSAQEIWLKADLAAHPNYCTLAYWHHPSFNSGHDGNLTAMQALLQDLYNADADVILGGHAHDYERFAPQNPSGQLDNARGIRQFVVGTGGAFFTSIGTIKPNSQVHQNSTYGVLKMTLHPTSYDWQFVPEAGKTFTDSGSTACHGSTPPSDTTKPSPPGNLTATPGSGQVALSWQASTDNMGVTGYRVYRSGTEIASVGGTTLSYTDTGLAAGTYGYTVRAVDAAANLSDPSNTASATVSPSDTQKPTVPSNLSATATSWSRIDLSWQASSDDVGVTGYRVYRNGAQIASIGAATGYSDTSVTPSTSYSYAVRAFDAAGNLSDPSNTASTTTPAQTVFTFSPQADARVEESKPKANFGTSYLRTDGTSHARAESYLSFTVSGVPAGPLRSVKLRVHSMSDATVDGPGVFGTSTGWKENAIKWSSRPTATSSVTDDKGAIAADSWVEFDVSPIVTGSGTYSFGLTSSSSDSVDFYSREAASFRPELVVTTGAADTTPPTAPANLNATATSLGQIDLSWQASTDNVGVTGYAVYRDGALIASIGPSTSYSDKSVIGGVTYSYTVRALDAAGNVSDPSNTDTVTATAGSGDTERPTAPANLNATAVSPTQVALSWQASSDNVGVTGYKAYREGALIASLGTTTSYSDTSVAANNTYHYEVRALDAAGNLSDPSNTATATTPAAATVLTIAPEADAPVEQSTPTTNYATSNLRTDFSTSTSNVESYLRFTVSGAAGTVQSAKLRLHSTSDGTADGPAVYTTSSSWGETTINWSNRPSRTSSATDDKGAIPADSWVEYDVAPFVTGNGTYSFNLVTTSTDGVNFYSREAATLRPELVLTLG
jgi:fibronectin type 3 domain-containing protein